MKYTNSILRLENIDLWMSTTTELSSIHQPEHAVKYLYRVFQSPLSLSSPPQFPSSKKKYLANIQYIEILDPRLSAFNCWQTEPASCLATGVIPLI